MARHNKHLKLFYQNVRGLRSKTDLFFDNLLLSDVDIALITETWLCDGILDTELCSSDRYDLFRRDRGSLGGGVMIACAARLQARVRCDLDRDGLECICITISAGALGSHHDLNIICAYIPPNRALPFQLQKLGEMLTYLFDSQPDDYYIVAGDYNMPCIDWKNKNPIVLKKGSVEAQNSALDFINLTSYLDLSQYNFFHNAYDNLLDLVFSNTPLSIEKSDFPLVNEDSCHPAIDIYLTDVTVPTIKPSIRKKYLFRKADYLNLNTNFSCYDWSFLSTQTLQDAIDNFYISLKTAISEFVPQKTVSRSHAYPVWYGDALIKIIKEKAKFHRLWKKYGNPDDYSTFSILRARLKKKRPEYYSSYIRFLEGNIKLAPKLFWTYVKSKRKNQCNYPSLMQYNRSSLSNQLDICNAFNDYFCRNFSQPSHRYAAFSEDCAPCCDVISVIDITAADISKLLKNLDCSKGAGCDEIPPYFFVKCSHSLAVPITTLFNRCFSEGYFPKIWKTANIVPVHKKGSKTDIENYRPISILNVLSKLMERVVHSHIYPFILRHIPAQQHGFIRGRSTNTNLSIFVNDVLRGMDCGYQIDVIYTDFEKAFDRVDHIILLRKLQELGIRGSLLRWVESYLRNRSQAVVVAGHRSDLVHVPSGVPQGSILGPLLYAAYLYDVGNCFKYARFLMYADDTKIYACIKTVEDAMKLQGDLNQLCRFYEDNRIGVNVSKCFQISFTRKRNMLTYQYSLDKAPLERTYVTKDLGVIFDSKMSMTDHITTMVNKAFRNLGFVLRVSRPFSDAECIRVLYFSYVRSILEYCSNVWNPNYITYIESIERLQSRFIKALNYRTYHKKVSYEESCTFHNLMQLKDRRTLLEMLYLHDVCSGRIDCPELVSLFLQIRAPKRRTRHTPLFQVPLSRTNYAQNSIICRSLNTYNKSFSSIDIFHLSKSSFKKHISHALVNS